MTRDTEGAQGCAALRTVADALAEAQARGVDRRDAQTLLGARLGWTRAQVLARDDRALEPSMAQAIAHDIAQRAEGVPVAYLTGTREFYGLLLRVTPAVLVPRPETESLVHWALEVLQARAEGACLAARSLAAADLGTGSGAIAIALAHAWTHSRRPSDPALQLIATDASHEALTVARANADALAGTVSMRLGHQDHWYAPFTPGERLDLIVSNPPYIAAGDPHLPALRHEPRAALVAPSSGLADLRSIVKGAPEHLLRGGWLLLEHGHDQGAAVRDWLAQAGFHEISTRNDLAGLPRLTGGRFAGD